MCQVSFFVGQIEWSWEKRGQKRLCQKVDMFMMAAVHLVPDREGHC